MKCGHNRDNENDREHVNNGQQSNEGLSGKDVSLLEECERLKADLAQWRDKCLRMQADFENTKKRIQKEQEDFKRFAEFSIVSDMLPLVDDFERAMDACKKNKDFNLIMKGVDLIGKDIKALLAKYGVVEMDCLGKPFDPVFHEAIAEGMDKDMPDGSILEIYQKGYLYKQRVLRPAVVKVNKVDSVSQVQTPGQAGQESIGFGELGTNNCDTTTEKDGS